MREVLNNFNADGFESLYPKYVGGRPPRFTLPQCREIKKVALSRALIHAMVEVTRPTASDTICDPACGTGGFLLATHDYIAQAYDLDKDEKERLRYDALRGWEIVDATARLRAMNLYLHGIGGDEQVPIHVDDSLRSDPDDRFSMVLANPPFGRKSAVTYVTETGQKQREDATFIRDDFWASGRAKARSNFHSRMARRSLMRFCHPTRTSHSSKSGHTG